MAGFTIRDGCACGVTLVPNSFIEDAMLRANGDFVRIYLWLLRAAQHPQHPEGLAALADVFSCTEGDIRRALRYWEDEGLLALTCEGEDILGIELLPAGGGHTVPDAAQALPAQAGHTVPGTSGQAEQAAAARDALPAAARPSELMTTGRANQIRKGSSEAAEIVNIAKQYFATAGKGDLKPAYIRALFYFYEELHFPVDLLDYLVEYCLNRGKASVEYLEAVGIGWHREGITTLAQAKAYKRMLGKYYSIFRYFSQKDDPTPEDIAYMDRWLNDYKFPLGVIERAAHKTRRHTASGDRAALFAYAEKILRDWRDRDVRTVEDAKALDEEFNAKKAARQDGSSPRAEAPKKKGSYHNRYNDFPQRDNDYAQIQEDWIRTQFGK